MPARRIATAVALLAALLPVSEALADQKGPTAHRAPEKPATRADVLAGRATRAQTIDLLKASVEAAGGSTVQVESAPSSPPPSIGGYAYPILAVDLDGDGDDESILIQYSDRQYLVAVDDGEVLWRHATSPDSAYVERIGVLPANLWAEGGTGVLLVGMEWNEDGPLTAHIDAFGAEGWRFSHSSSVDWFELNGLVQADADPQDEIALTVWQGTSPIAIAIVDAEGGPARLIRPSLEETLGRSMSTEAFITDGPGTGPDEAVFVTPLLTGYHGERRSLADGLQTAFDVKVNAEVPTLYQGPDYTGDGRRDAFISEYSGGPFEFTVTFGVFDGAGFSSPWTQTSEDEYFPYFPPYQPGDADGDGGQDLCLRENSHEWDEVQRSSSVTVSCLAGATGAELWQASRSVTGHYAWAYAFPWSDLDADGVIDPVLFAETSTCSEEDWSCETASFEAAALNGVDGSVIWSVDDIEAGDLAWGITDTNLDGVAGDDIITSPYEEPQPPDAPFKVHNGLSLDASWGSVIDTGEIPGYAGSAMEADLDGDGSAEAIIAAEAYEETDRMVCYEFFDEEYCYNEWDEYSYLAAFEPGGELLWQLEL